MKTDTYTILFLDNLVAHIYKTVDYLKSKNYNVTVCQSVSDFYEKLNNTIPSVILIHLDLDGSDGITLMNELKASRPNAKWFIGIYSSKQDDYIQQLAYDNGADAYIGFYDKPVLTELFIRNLLNRIERPEKHPSNGKLFLDEEHYCIKLNEQKHTLPRKEFHILKLFINTPHLILSKTDIARVLWNDEQIASKRIIDVHIYNIRKELGQHIILSVKGKGYLMNQKYL